MPYANLTNPQTLNLYAMVSDNPETFADLDGHMVVFSGETWMAGNFIASPPEAQQSTTANNQTAGQNQSGTIPGTSQPTALQPPKPPADALKKTEYLSTDAAGREAENRVNPNSIKQNQE